MRQPLAGATHTKVCQAIKSIWFGVFWLSKVCQAIKSIDSGLISMSRSIKYM